MPKDQVADQAGQKNRSRFRLRFFWHSFLLVLEGHPIWTLYCAPLSLQQCKIHWADLKQRPRTRFEGEVHKSTGFNYSCE
jgi:hypothetical protein